MFFDQVSLDIGTASTKLVDLEREITLRESSVIAFKTNSETVMDVGNHAEQLRGRFQGNFSLRYPIQRGTIVLPYEAESLLSHLFRHIYQRSQFLRPRVVACIPSQASLIERRALKESIEQSGAVLSYFVDVAVAVAIGADLPILEPVGTMIVNIGEGLTQVTVLSNTGVLLADSVTIAGFHCTEVIQRIVKQRYQLQIGWLSAQEIKHHLGSVDPQGDLDKKEMNISGLNLISGLPTLERLHGHELRPFLTEAAQILLFTIRRVLESLPAELASDVRMSGIRLAGGGSCLHGLASLIEQTFEIPTSLVNDPINAAAIGAYKAMKDPSQFSIFLES